MTDTIKIESGIRIPPRTGGGPGNGATDALRRLSRAKIGDSIFIPATTAKATSIANLVSAAGKGKWTTMRKVEGGTRVWKIAEPEKVLP